MTKMLKIIDQKDQSLKPTETTFAVQTAIEHMKRFHPALWNRMDEDDLIQAVALCYLLFIARPEILEATTQSRYLPTQ